jgi:hypothetical protein
MGRSNFCDRNPDTYPERLLLQNVGDGDRALRQPL